MGNINWQTGGLSMKSLKETRLENGLSQQGLAQRTGLSQGTISNLEREVTAPTRNQRIVLEQALGALSWPENRDFSQLEKKEIVEAFAVCVNRLGPRKTLDLMAATRTNDELRGMASLFAPQVESEEPLDLPDHNRKEASQ